jgi:uncharacterized repeat protein (TIGR03803 family)
MMTLRRMRASCAVLALYAATAIAVNAQTFTTLLDFDGADGAQPHIAPLAQGADGAFYGTTEAGGSVTASVCKPYGCGTAFKVDSAGTLASLRLIPADGSEPAAGLTLAADGTFYGTAFSGGANDGGTIFKITQSGEQVELYSFCAQPNCADGFGPQSGLTQAANGNFYGTTPFGGANGEGTVFEITAGGALTTLHSFDGTDGAAPFAGPIQASDGNFYGTTQSGGANNDGTVYEITSAGTLTTLHSFDETDGSAPFGGLVQASDGNFYGMTDVGGANGSGTIYKITSAGALTTLYNFADGYGSYAALIQATDGDLYGTTGGGGVNQRGTVFKITLGGTLTTLYSFCSQAGCSDGRSPFAGLVQATDGNFYGTTVYGGNPSCDPGYGCGTVFSLSTGLGPFVAFVSGAAKTGQSFGILGQGFTGTTGVSLNGASASFKVASDTFIEATVPSGATTGSVTVTTPSGTLTSNLPFNVIP